MTSFREHISEFWWLYNLSLLDTMEIKFSDVKVEQRYGLIAICVNNGELTYHGIAGHE